MIGDLKRCFKCEQEKPRDEFYAHPMMADGLLGKCKVCVRAAVSEHRRLNHERIKAYDRARGNRQPREYAQEWRRKNKLAIMEKHRAARTLEPEKYIARNAVNNAIRDGTLIKQPCERCGADNTHGHHEDYSKPLEVIWLCPTHHGERHREINEKRRTESRWAMQA